MRISKLLVASFALVVGVSACASSGSGDGPEVSTNTGSGTPNILVAAEIEKENVPTAYEAVDRRRRKWWRDVKATSNTVAVYMDNKKQGGPDFLKEIPAQDVQYLEYLNGSQAVMRFGQDAAGGAIIVHRK